MGNAPLPPEIQERMEVVDSQGVHVGIVDHVEGDYIKLTKEHPNDTKHHFVSKEYVTGVDERVHLSRPLDVLRQHWGKVR